MKAKVFYEMTNDELGLKLKELKQEWFNLRFQHATGQLSNPNQLSVCKKDIARVMTVIRQRELNVVQEPEAAPVKKTRTRAKKAESAES